MSSEPSIAPPTDAETVIEVCDVGKCYQIYERDVYKRQLRWC